MPILQTSRLLLRPLLPHDLPVMHSTIYADPDTMRYIVGGRRPSLEVTEFIFDSMRRHALEHGFGYMAVEGLDDRGFRGLCGLKFIGQQKEVEMGYVLQKQHWGQGLATELVGALLQHGFVDLGLAQIGAMVMPGNTASVRVLEKNRLRLQGHRLCHAQKMLYYSIERGMDTPTS